MGDYDFVNDGADYAWVDTPGYEFVDSDIHVIRLQHLRALDVSQHLRALDVSQHLRASIIIGGQIVQSDIEIFNEAGNIIDLQLTAENADTGEVAPLTQSQMATITGCKLALDGVVIDSAGAGVGLGQDKPFDNVSRAAEGILSIDMGGQSLAAKAYRVCLLSIQFSNSLKPKVINLRRKTIVYPPI